MKQARLEFGSGRKITAKQRDRYDEGNLASARIFLEDSQRWGGEQAGLVQWAHEVIARLNKKETN
jgi:hypothetical protein